MEPKKQLPTRCPSCQSQLHVASLHCPACYTCIDGDYLLPTFLLLSAEEQQFILDFVLCSGSLKEIAARMELSYPTVRNRLDEIILKLKSFEA